MRHLSSLVPSSAFAATVALFSSSAAAHIELIEPAPRYVLPANKSCPCGDGDSNRTCQVTAAESTDPNRSTNVTTFEAGSIITIVVEEYIDHAGRLRVVGREVSRFHPIDPVRGGSILSRLQVSDEPGEAAPSRDLGDHPILRTSARISSRVDRS